MEGRDLWGRSVARKETLGVHQKNWVCHIYCQINAQKKRKKKHAYVCVCVFVCLLFIKHF